MWGSLFGFVGKIVTGLFGGSTSGGQPTLASQLIEKVLPATDKERAEMAIREQEEDIKDVSSARAYEPTDLAPFPISQVGIIPFFLTWIISAMNQIVNMVIHMIRPGVLIWLVGGFSGGWKLPDPTMIDPALWTVFMIVITFYFGARTLVKDVPSMLQAIAALRKK